MHLKAGSERLSTKFYQPFSVLSMEIFGFFGIFAAFFRLKSRQGGAQENRDVI